MIMHKVLYVQLRFTKHYICILFYACRNLYSKKDMHDREETVRLKNPLFLYLTG